MVLVTLLARYRAGCGAPAQHRTILATRVYEGTTMRGESELESEVRKRVIQARCISTISMLETFVRPSSVSISSVEIRISFFATP